ncbi:MAG: hypothetical protein FJ315_07930 [SAR202 cluster bacterium]|nr:hypothetical protein [SAR202 cluster bacterium]
MVKRLLLISGAFALILLIGVAVVGLLATRPITVPAPTPTPIASPRASPPSGFATPVPAATPIPGATVQRPVVFDLAIEQTRSPDASVLLSARVRVFLRAELYNLGDTAAHNVRVETRARVGEGYVPLDGQPAFLVTIGTVGARQASVRDVSFELRMSLSQGRRAQAEGIIFEVVVFSDERTQSFPPMRCSENECTGP